MLKTLKKEAFIMAIFKIKQWEIESNQLTYLT